MRPTLNLPVVAKGHGMDISREAPELVTPGRFNISPKPPPLVLCPPKPDPRAVVKVLYSVLPARAVSDQRLSPGTWRTFAALCLHTSPFGICYPSVKRLALICGRHVRTIHGDLAQLVKLGYVRRLKSLRKGTMHAARRQVIYVPGAPLPPKERLDEFQLPWRFPFNDGRQPEGKQVSITSQKESPMQPKAAAMSMKEGFEYEKAHGGKFLRGHAMSEAQVAVHQRYILFEHDRDAAAAQIAARFVEMKHKHWKIGTNNAACVPVALKWLAAGVEPKAACAYIVTTLAKMAAAGVMPPVTLDQLPPPDVVRPMLKSKN